MSALRVLEPGPSTTVQDLGRPGHAGLGVAASGVLDPSAARLANRIVGNDEGAAVLEVVLGGLVLRADDACVLSLTGAPTILRVNADGIARSHGSGSAVHVPAGATVHLQTPTSGLRSWLAVRGGFESSLVLGSAATDVLAGINGPLVEGHVLPIGPPPSHEVPSLDQAPLSVPAATDVVLRTVLGPRHDWFTPESVAALTEAWTVDPRSNRVGIRLDGSPLERMTERRDAELPSEGAVAGAVQVAANGRPVLFLADHPVTGGYPVIGCVVTADLPLAAQAVPGQSVRFHIVQGPQLP